MLTVRTRNRGFFLLLLLAMIAAVLIWVGFRPDTRRPGRARLVLETHSESHKEGAI